MTYPSRKKLTEYPIVTPTLADSVVNIQGNTVKRSTLQSILALFSANSPAPTLPYKVFTGLITQNGGTLLQNKNAGDTLVQGVTYYIVSNGGYDFIPLGAPSNTVGTYFICNQTIITGLGIPFDLQYNTGAPVCNVLENTLGNVWFEYVAFGQYSCNFLPIADFNKTFCLATNNDSAQNYSLGFLEFGSYVNGQINIVNWDLTGNLFNGMYQAIEIRVYN